MSEYEIIRGMVDGKAKYCRIPIRSRVAERMMEDGATKLSAEAILEMPHDTAIKTIDALMSDWMYWLNRANELFILWQGCQPPEEDKNNG